MYSKKNKPKIGDIVIKQYDFMAHLRHFELGIIADIVNYDFCPSIRMANGGEIYTDPAFPLTIIFIRPQDLSHSPLVFNSIACATTEIVKANEYELVMLGLSGKLSNPMKDLFEAAKEHLKDPANSKLDLSEMRRLLHLRNYKELNKC